MKEVLFHSPSTGVPWHGLNLEELFREVAAEILSKATYWTKAIRAITHFDTKAVSLASVGSSNTAQAIQLALEKEGKTVRWREIWIVPISVSLEVGNPLISLSLGYPGDFLVLKSWTTFGNSW